MAFRGCRDRAVRVPGVVVLVVDDGAVVGEDLLLQADQFPGVRNVRPLVVAVRRKLVHGCFVVGHEVLGGAFRAVAPVAEAGQYVHPCP